VGILIFWSYLTGLNPLLLTPFYFNH